MSANELSLQIMSWAQNQLSLWQSTAKDQQIASISLTINIPESGMKQFNVEVQYQKAATANASGKSTRK